MSAIYLLDNNVISRMTPIQRSSQFVRERCFITEDVAHEGRGYAEDLASIRVIRRSAGMLAHLARIMRLIAPSDTSLVDLYANKGAADPVLIATALEGMEAERDRLFQHKIRVVTEDRAVRRLSTDVGVDVLSLEEFLELGSDPSATTHWMDHGPWQLVPARV
ncbi:hypothetical protein ACSBQY_00975 [Micrococcus lylae]|uniref:hypothetical protein n=1 Tax=Micrococcus lylae TaxID=1273 RepID=UPI003EBF9027